MKVDSQMTAPEKTDRDVKSSKRSKKSRGKPGRKPRVSSVLPPFIFIPLTFKPVFCKEVTYYVGLQKSAENDKDGTNRTMEDGPGEGFTVLAAKSLFLGQKVLIDSTHNCCLLDLIYRVACRSIQPPWNLITND